MYRDNLKELKEILNLTTGQMAEQLGMSARTLGGYERGERTPSVDFPTLLSKVFNVNINWFLTGEGEIFTQKSNFIEQSLSVNIDCISLPYIQASAGGGYSLISNARISVPMDELKKLGYLIFDNLVIVKISGNSMAEKINDGDILVIDTNFQNIQDGKIYVLNYGGQLFCKRLLAGAKYLILKSDNPDYPPEKIEGDEFDKLKIIGKVVFKMCSFK